MKNDKFCVSKTLAYLVALVVAVVGAFYAMNYVNTQKLTSNSKASPPSCTWASVANYPGGCGVTSQNNKGLSTAMGTTFTEDPSRNYMTGSSNNRVIVSRCCVGQAAQANPPLQGAKTCKGWGGSGWYSDASAANLQTRLNKNVPQGGTTSVVTEITNTMSDPKQGMRCYKITYSYANSGTKTCKQKGGSDWYSDTSAVNLQTRLNKNVSQGGTKAVVAEVQGPFSDTKQGRKCYTITYNYTNQNTGATKTCSQAGGSGYFTGTISEVDARFSQGVTNYDVVVTTPTGPFTDQKANLTCYKISYDSTNIVRTCYDQGGLWFGNRSCAEAETEWDPNSKTSEVIKDPTFTWSDTRQGSVCCVR